MSDELRQKLKETMQPHIGKTVDEALKQSLLEDIKRNFAEVYQPLFGESTPEQRRAVEANIKKAMEGFGFTDVQVKESEDGKYDVTGTMPIPDDVEINITFEQ